VLSLLIHIFAFAVHKKRFNSIGRKEIRDSLEEHVIEVEAPISTRKGQRYRAGVNGMCDLTQFRPVRHLPRYTPILYKSK